MPEPRPDEELVDFVAVVIQEPPPASKAAATHVCARVAKAMAIAYARGGDLAAVNLTSRRIDAPDAPDHGHVRFTLTCPRRTA